MARLPYLNKEDLKPEDREILNRNINLYRIMAHSPAPPGGRARAATVEGASDAPVRTPVRTSGPLVN